MLCPWSTGGSRRLSMHVIGPTCCSRALPMRGWGSFSITWRNVDGGVTGVMALVEEFEQMQGCGSEHSQGDGHRRIAGLKYGDGRSDGDPPGGCVPVVARVAFSQRCPPHESSISRSRSRLGRQIAILALGKTPRSHPRWAAAVPHATSIGPTRVPALLMSLAGGIETGPAGVGLGKWPRDSKERPTAIKASSKMAFPLKVRLA